MQTLDAPDGRPRHQCDSRIATSQLMLRSLLSLLAHCIASPALPRQDFTLYFSASGAATTRPCAGYVLICARRCVREGGQLRGIERNSGAAEGGRRPNIVPASWGLDLNETRRPKSAVPKRPQKAHIAATGRSSSPIRTSKSRPRSGGLPGQRFFVRMRASRGQLRLFSEPCFGSLPPCFSGACLRRLHGLQRLHGRWRSHGLWRLHVLRRLLGCRNSVGCGDSTRCCDCIGCGDSFGCGDASERGEIRTKHVSWPYTGTA